MSAEVKMSPSTHFVGTAGLPQQADLPADGRRFRVGPTADSCAAQTTCARERKVQGICLNLHSPDDALREGREPRPLSEFCSPLIGL